MSNWIYGKDLIEHWNIEDFELFGFLKNGLQPYDKHGRKVIDLDSSEWARERTLEYCENLVRGTQETGIVVTRSSRIPVRITEHEIKQRGKELYESQTPKDSPYISFSLPSNEKEATKAIASVKSFKFKKDEASDFEKKRLNKLSDCYQDLKLPELKVMVDGWANEFSVIKQIILYRANDGKYVLDVRVDDSDKIKYRSFTERWIDKNYYLNRLRDAYKTPNTDYYGEWLFFLLEVGDEPLSSEANHVQTDSRLILFPRDDKSLIEKYKPFQTGNDKEQIPSSNQEPDAIIKAFTIIPESDYEIKIKEPGKAPISYPHHIINFKTKKTLWRTFLEIINNDGICNVGPSGSQNIDVKNEYDKKR